MKNTNTDAKWKKKTMWFSTRLTSIPRRLDDKTQKDEKSKTSTKSKNAQGQIQVQRPLKVEIHQSTISTDGFHSKSITTATILRFLTTIWLLRWPPRLFNRGVVAIVTKDPIEDPIDTINQDYKKIPFAFLMFLVLQRPNLAITKNRCWKWLFDFLWFEKSYYCQKAQPEALLQPWGVYHV